MKTNFLCMEKRKKISLRKLLISDFCSALISNYWSTENILCYYPSLDYSQNAGVNLHILVCTQLRTLEVFSMDIPLTQYKLNWRSVLTSESESVGSISYVSLHLTSFLNSVTLI